MCMHLVIAVFVLISQQLTINSWDESIGEETPSQKNSDLYVFEQTYSILWPKILSITLRQWRICVHCCKPVTGSTIDGIIKKKLQLPIPHQLLISNIADELKIAAD